MQKKAFIIRLAYFLVFICAVIVLFLLIKNSWDVSKVMAAIKSMF